MSETPETTPETQDPTVEGSDVTTQDAPTDNVDAPETPESPTVEDAEPEVIEYKLESPKESVLPDSHMESVIEYAKQNKLSNEQAQKLLERDNGLIAGFQEQKESEFKATAAAWVDQTKKDPEIGGDHFEENVTLAKNALKEFGSDTLLTQLDETGFGNHPEIVRTFSRIGKLLAEDKIILSGHTPKKEKTMEERWYPNQAKQS